MRFSFAGMNNLADPASPELLKKGQCVDICNCDINDEHYPSRRSGSLLVSAGAVSSGWTSPVSGISYCVSGGYLCTFNGTSIVPLTTAFTVGVCEFEQVNNVVVFSDNAKIGIIDGATVTRIDIAADWVDVADLEQWVIDHYPADPADWNGIASNSNMAVDAHKLATLAGRCLCFYNGALYLAIGNFVYCTKTHAVEVMDIRYNVVAGFSSDVTMIQAVAGGLFVGTAAGVYFLEGAGLVVDEKGTVQSGFSQRTVSRYGAMYGTDVALEGQLIPRLQYSGLVALWSCTMGIFAGMSGGTVVNLSADTLQLPNVTAGTALFRQANGLNQYLVCFDISSALFVSSDTAIDTAALRGTWVLNTMKGTHSRYSGFLFNSMFMRGSDCYGCNKLGLFRLSGATDFSGVAPLSSRISAFVKTPSTGFAKREAKQLQALYLQARCAGELALDYYVNETLAAEDDVILFDDEATAHTLRAHPPRGLRGSMWQFVIKNVNGADFTLCNLEPVVLVAAGRTR